MKKSPNSTPPKTPSSEKIAELTADLQRTRADFENYRKQVELQRLQAINIAKLSTVSKILPLLDDIERAIFTHPELKPLEKELEKILTELNLTRIDTTPGTEFNPSLHEAVTMIEAEGEKEVIAETLRPGYIYEGETLRPAMVKVTTA